VRLGEVASVRSGLVLKRKEAKPDQPSIVYRALNLRSIIPNGYLDATQLDLFSASEVLSPDYLTHEGDIVIRLTAPYTAILIDKSTAGIIITSNFVVIRVDSKLMLPSYLAWLLNTPKQKKQIYESATGNMLSAINAKYYANLNLTLLPIDDQRKIAKLNQLAQRETKLLLRLAEEKAKYYAEMIDAAQRNMRRNHKP